MLDSIIGNATGKSLLRKARMHSAKHLIAICGDGGTNVEIAVKAYQLVRERRSASKRVLQCFVHIVDLKLCALFKQHKIFAETGDLFETKVFNIYENSARSLLEEYPLDRGLVSDVDPRVVHLIVLGFGQMGESVVLQAAKVGHYANGKKLCITVIDREADRKQRIFHHRYPQFDQVCEAFFLKEDIEDPEFLEEVLRRDDGENSITTVVISLDDDSRSLSCALSLLPKLDERNIPIMVRMAEDAGLATLVQDDSDNSSWAARVDAFGMINLTCTQKILLNEELDLLAKEIHKDFVAKRKKEGRTPETDPALLPWDQLDENYKESNRQQADHIPVKLRAIRCYSPHLKEGMPVVTTFTDEEVELMAKMEHARWNSERFLAGWTRGPKYPERKISPYLVGWDELPEHVKDYDRDAVRNIPYLLGQIGEKIYRESCIERSDSDG